MKFKNTHKLTIKTTGITKEGNKIPYTEEIFVEVGCDSEINTLNEILIIPQEKIEPMDDYPIFYSTTLIEILDCGFDIKLTALNEKKYIL
jgi:hypothetical protein